jgi:L-threonylcarbamoyladenylate synthase
MTKILKIKTKNDKKKILEAVKILKNNELVAIPTETVYGLAGNALSSSTIKKIFKAKGRPSDNPLIVHIAEKEDLKKIVREIPPKAKKLINKFWPGPLTIVLKKSKIIPDEITCGLDTVAVRLPSHEIAREIIRVAKMPLAAPSANTSGRPSPTTAKHVKEDLNGKIKLIVDSGACDIGLESTVINLVNSTPILLRPGKITYKQIKKEIGKIKIHPSIKGKKIKGKVGSPGMKYRHYAPKAQLILANEKDFKKIIVKERKLGKRIGVMARNGKIECDSLKIIGNSLEEIGRNIFSKLREFDDENIDVIIAPKFLKKEFGMAIMNRLEKASSKK